MKDFEWTRGLLIFIWSGGSLQHEASVSLRTVQRRVGRRKITTSSSPTHIYAQDLWNCEWQRWDCCRDAEESLLRSRTSRNVNTEV